MGATMGGLLRVLIFAGAVLVNAERPPNSTSANTVVVAGSSVAFNCQLESRKEIRWQKHTAVGSVPAILNNGSVIIAADASRYTLQFNEKTGNSELRIAPAQLTDAGLFECRAADGSSAARTFNLVIFAEELACSMGKETAGRRRVECSLAYAGSWKPTITCLPDVPGNKTVSDVTVLNATRMTIVGDYPLETSAVQCHVMFVNYSQYSGIEPSYRYTWKLPDTPSNAGLPYWKYIVIGSAGVLALLLLVAAIIAICRCCKAHKEFNVPALIEYTRVDRTATRVKHYIQTGNANRTNSKRAPPVPVPTYRPKSSCQYINAADTNSAILEECFDLDFIDPYATLNPVADEECDTEET